MTPCHFAERGQRKDDTLSTFRRSARLYDLLVVAVTTGMRQGELFALQWEDVDLEAATVHVRHTLENLDGRPRLKPPKSASGRRSIKLPQMTVDALQERRKQALTEGMAGSRWVFPDTQGGPIRKTNFIRNVYHPLLRKTGLPNVRFHDLRHSAATVLLSLGEHLTQRTGFPMIPVPVKDSRKEFLMIRSQALIAVHDADRSSRWYQQLLDCTDGNPGKDFRPLLRDGELVLRIHRWDPDNHPHMGDPKQRPYGNGILLWFEIDEFDDAVERARELGAKILEEPHINPMAQHRECWLLDPDGYVVVLSGQCGEAA